MRARYEVQLKAPMKEVFGSTRITSRMTEEASSAQLDAARDEMSGVIANPEACLYIPDGHGHTYMIPTANVAYVKEERSGDEPEPAVEEQANEEEPGPEPEPEHEGPYAPIGQGRRY